MPKKQPSKRERLSKAKSQIRLSHLVHTILNMILPIAVLVLVRLDLIEIALGLVILSKWRIFAVVPRHWLANLRSNATDLIVNLATFAFIVDSSELNVQLAWTAWYLIWLIVIKPRSDTVMVALQALSGLFLGITALFQFTNLNEVFVLLGVWLIATSAARHFLSSYEEPFTRPLSYLWGLVVVQLTWVLYRWTLMYFIVPQLILIVGVLAYTLASLYDQNKKEVLSPKIVRQHVFLASVIIVVIIAMSDWSGAELLG